MDVDLNIDNYDYDDLLNLFNLTYNFGEEEIKKVKKTVLMTHPDKSGLDKSYFLFFKKAYKMLMEIYYFRGKKKRSTEYVVEENKEHLELIKGLDGKSISEFNNWFNKMFESVKLEDDEMDNGYGDWLVNGELEDMKHIHRKDFGREFEKKKKKCKEMVLYNGIEDTLTNNGGSNLLRERPQLYNSNIFSKLKYEDLKRAHTETVVPVTNEDFEKVEKFNNVSQYMLHRKNTMSKPLTMTESKELLRKNNEKNDKNSVERAYKLIKREEQMEKAQEKWWRNFKRLKG